MLDPRVLVLRVDTVQAAALVYPVLAVMGLQDPDAGE
jgi:hypothetical protein